MRSGGHRQKWPQPAFQCWGKRGVCVVYTGLAKHFVWVCHEIVWKTWTNFLVNSMQRNLVGSLSSIPWVQLTVLSCQSRSDQVHGMSRTQNSSSGHTKQVFRTLRAAEKWGGFPEAVPAYPCSSMVWQNSITTLALRITTVFSVYVFSVPASTMLYFV